LLFIGVHNGGGALVGCLEAFGEAGEIAPGGDQAIVIGWVKFGDVHGPISSSAPAGTTARTLALCRVSRLDRCG